MSSEQLYERYDRQIQVIGIEGQMKLAKSKVAVIGAGGLGSPLILYLAAAGIGKIIVVDKDTVSLSDLNRQILYIEADIGKKKVDIVCKRIKRFNSLVDIECIDMEFNEDNG
ncbi:MAG: ThiF family adenylyltransferase, partial [Ignisphaera sp.]